VPLFSDITEESQVGEMYWDPDNKRLLFLPEADCVFTVSSGNCEKKKKS